MGIFDGLANNDGLRRKFEAQIDKTSVDKLIRNLSKRNKNVRLNSIAGLQRKRDPKAVDPLTALLNDPDEDIKGTAAEALSIIGDKRAIDPIIALLSDNNFVVRAAGAHSLRNFREARVAEALMTSMSDENEMVRGLARGSLVMFYESWVQLTMYNLINQNNGSFMKALDYMGDFGALFIEDEVEKKDPIELINKLAVPIPPVYQATCDCLVEIGGNEVIDALIQEVRNHGNWLVINSSKLPAAATLKQEDAALHNMKMFTAGKALGGLQPESTEAIISEFENANCGAYGRAILLHALISKNDSSSIDVLLKALNDHDDAVRSNAALALGMLGDQKALGSLIAIIEDENETLRSNMGGYASTFRLAVIDAIGSIAGLDSKEFLRPLLEDENETVRQHAQAAMEETECVVLPINIIPREGSF